MLPIMYRCAPQSECSRPAQKKPSAPTLAEQGNAPESSSGRTTGSDTKEAENQTEIKSGPSRDQPTSTRANGLLLDIVLCNPKSPDEITMVEKLQNYLLVLPGLRIEIVEYKQSDASNTMNAIIAAIQHRLSVPEIKTIVIHPAWVLLNHSAFPFQEHPNKDYCST